MANGLPIFTPELFVKPILPVFVYLFFRSVTHTSFGQAGNTSPLPCPPVANRKPPDEFKCLQIGTSKKNCLHANTFPNRIKILSFFSSSLPVADYFLNKSLKWRNLFPPVLFRPHFATDWAFRNRFSTKFGNPRSVENWKTDFLNQCGQKIASISDFDRKMGRGCVCG